MKGNGETLTLVDSNKLANFDVQLADGEVRSGERTKANG